MAEPVLGHGHHGVLRAGVDEVAHGVPARLRGGVSEHGAAREEVRHVVQARQLGVRPPGQIRSLAPHRPAAGRVAGGLRAHDVLAVELQTKVRKDFTVTERALSIEETLLLHSHL